MFNIPTGLTTNLISVWPFNEASGDALDIIGSNTLTASASNPGTTSGHLVGARTFADVSKYFSLTDNADLSVGGTSFTFTGWFNLSNRWPEGYHSQLSKWNNSVSAGAAEYILYLDTGNGYKPTFQCSYDGLAANSTPIQANVEIFLNTWYFFVAYHDYSTHKLGLIIKQGSNTYQPAEVSFNSGGVFNGTQPLIISKCTNLVDFEMQGRVDQYMFWKRLLTPTEISYLYSMGASDSYEFEFLNDGPRQTATYTSGVHTFNPATIKNVRGFISTGTPDSTNYPFFIPNSTLTDMAGSGYSLIVSLASGYLISDDNTFDIDANDADGLTADDLSFALADSASNGAQSGSVTLYWDLVPGLGTAPRRNVVTGGLLL